MDDDRSPDPSNACKPAICRLLMMILTSYGALIVLTADQKARRDRILASLRRLRAEEITNEDFMVRSSSYCSLRA